MPGFEREIAWFRGLSQKERVAWGVIATVAISGLSAVAIGMQDDKFKNPMQERSERERAELGDNDYNMYTAPLHTRPKVEVRFKKLDNPIIPVCSEKSASLMVDSVLAETYVKGLGEPIVGYVSSLEFPELNAFQMDDCTSGQVATINASTALNK